MHVPQSAASDNVQQNETCIVTSLNTDNTDQFIQKKNVLEGKTNIMYLYHWVNTQTSYVWGFHKCCNETHEATLSHYWRVWQMWLAGSSCSFSNNRWSLCSRKHWNAYFLTSKWHLIFGRFCFNFWWSYGTTCLVTSKNWHLVLWNLSCLP